MTARELPTFALHKEHAQETLEKEKTEFDLKILHQKYAPLLYRTIRGLTGPGPHIDEIIQDTFVDAFLEQSKFDPKRGDEKAWLYGIAINRIKRMRQNRERSQRKIVILESIQNSDECQTSPESDLIQKETLAQINKATQSLPLRLREVFVLFELEEMSGQEIAQMLQIPLNTVWTRIRKGRELFKKAMRKLELGGQL